VHPGTVVEASWLGEPSVAISLTSAGVLPESFVLALTFCFDAGASG
jgi:hypothetical protein